MSENQTKFAFQVTRKGTFVWAGVLLFVMGWMFVLGILVGRGTAPIPLQAHALEQELQALKAAMLQQQRSEIETRVSPGDAPTTDLSFYEALRQPLAATQRRIADAPQPANKPAPAPSPAGKKPAASKPGPAPKPQKVVPVDAAPEPRPVAAKPEPPPKPAAEAPPSPAEKSRFTIQVGAFKEAAGADDMVNMLRGKGYPAYHLRTELPGKGVWYRVRVGAFEARAGAETMLIRLNGDSFKGMVVATP